METGAVPAGRVEGLSIHLGGDHALYLLQQQQKQRCTADLLTDFLATIQEQRMLSKVETCYPSVPERRDLFLSNAALIIQQESRVGQLACTHVCCFHQRALLQRLSARAGLQRSSSSSPQNEHVAAEQRATEFGPGSEPPPFLQARSLASSTVRTAPGLSHVSFEPHRPSPHPSPRSFPLLQQGSRDVFCRESPYDPLCSSGSMCLAFNEGNITDIF